MRFPQFRSFAQILDTVGSYYTVGSTYILYWFSCAIYILITIITGGGGVLNHHLAKITLAACLKVVVRPVFKENQQKIWLQPPEWLPTTRFLNALEFKGISVSHDMTKDERLNKLFGSSTNFALAFKIVNGHAPEYLAGMVSMFVPGRQLRVGRDDLMLETTSQVNTIGGKLSLTWNLLPRDLRCVKK